MKRCCECEHGRPSRWSEFKVGCHAHPPNANGEWPQLDQDEYCSEFVSVEKATQDAIKKAFPNFLAFPHVKKS